VEAQGTLPSPIDLQNPLNMTMGEVNLPFVDQQAVEQLEYLDKISVHWNRKLLAGSLLLTIVLVTGGYFLRNRFLENWAATWKLEAQELAAKGDWEAAGVKAKLALRLDPEDRATRLVAGRALVRPEASQREYEAGRALLEEHLAEDSLDREIRLLMVRAAMRRGDHSWVLTDGLAAVRSAIPTDPEFRTLALECHRVGGDWVEAARILVRAIDKTPQDPQLYRQLLEWIDVCQESVPRLRDFAEDLNPWRQTLDDNLEKMTAVRTREPEAADERLRQRLLRDQAVTVLQRMRTRAQPAWWFSVAMSEHALRQGDDMVAETYWRQARENSPEHPEVAALGAEVLETRWQTLAAAGDDQRVAQVERQARELLQQAVQKRDAALELFGILGRLQVLGKEYSAARQTYRAGLDAVAQHSSSPGEHVHQAWTVVFDLGLAESLAWGAEDASALELPELEQDWQRLESELAQQAVRPEVAEFVEGLREFSRGELPGAVRRFEDLRGRLLTQSNRPSHELIERVDTWLCECHRRLARTEQLEKSLRLALQVRPDWHQGRQELCRLLVRRGLSWQPVGEEEPDSESVSNLAELEWSFTEQLLRPRSQRSWNQVDTQLQTLASQDPTNPRIILLRAERAVDEGQVVAAVDLLSSQLKDDPDNPELALGLVRLLRWQSDRDRTDNAAWMAQVADSFRRAQGDRLVFRLLQAEARGLGSPLARRELGELSQFWEGVTNWPVRQKRGLARGLLRLAQHSGRDSSLIEIGRFAVEVGLWDLDLLALVAAAADRADETELAEQARAAIVRREGEAGPWGLLLAAYRRLLKLLPLNEAASAGPSAQTRDELSVALRDLEQASALCPEWGVPHRLRGMAWDLWGDPGEAAKAFQLAVRHGDRSPESQSWLTDHLFRLRRDSELVALHAGWSRENRPIVVPLELSPPGAFDLPLGGKPRRDQADQLTQIQVAVAREVPAEQTLPQIVELTTAAPHLTEAWRLRASLAVAQGGAAAGRAVVRQIAGAVPAAPPHRRALCEALGWDVLGEESQAEERFRAAVEVETDGWESTREWIAWLVRRGELGRAAAELVEPPPSLERGRIKGFQNWSRSVRHALGAAGAVALPEFRKHLAEMSPEGSGERNSFWQDRWYACLSRGRSASENQRLEQWLDQRGGAVGLTPDQRVARLRARLRRDDPQVWSDWRVESAGQPLDFETALLILTPVLRRPQLPVNADLEPLVEEAFAVLRRTEPKSLTTRAMDAARFVQQGFPQDGAAAYKLYRQRIPDKTPAELLLDLARSGRLMRLRSRLALAAPTPLPVDTPWSVLDRFPSHREVCLQRGELPELEPLWKHPAALECLRDEALLLVGLGLESIADVESAREVFEAYARHGRQPTDRFQPSLFLARQGELEEAQRLINEIGVSALNSEADLALGIAWVFDSAPVTNEENWSVSLRRLEQVRDQNLIAVEEQLVWQGLARLQALTGHEEQALEDYLRLLRDHPDDLIARNNLAWLRAITGQNLVEARADIDSLIALHGELPELLDTRATICLMEGDLPQAQADWELASAQASPGRYLAPLAICQARRGERAAAQRTARRAMETGFQPNDWPPPARDLWEGEFNALLKESAEGTTVTGAPLGTDAQNPLSKTEKSP
jgi:tetratricopeptide (TPR) repeat protein